MRFVFIGLFYLACTFFVLAQEEKASNPFVLDVNYFYGSIAEHNDEIAHLITHHPEGIILSYSQKTYGKKAWEGRNNYPDYGFSFIGQNMKNRYLGQHYGIYAHYNFYFSRRRFIFRVGQGISYATNPYNRNINYRNNAYGTRFLSSTYGMLLYKKENVFDGFGFNVGFTGIHYSNANFKAPNASTNTVALSLGINYLVGHKNEPKRPKYFEDPIKNEYFRYNLALLGGINESDVVGTGQFPFFSFSAYVDRRINNLSVVNAGIDVFFSMFLKEHIRYLSIAHPQSGVTTNTDYKRAGVFIGHELFINRITVLTQVGLYFYYPFDFEGRLYNRIGLKRYLTNDLFVSLTLKAHAAKAEALEFGIGFRL